MATGDLDFAAALEKMMTGAATGLKLAGEHILQVSNTTVPIEEGTLERSGKVAEPERDGDQVVSAVSYDTPYAVIQHEDLTFHHDQGRSAKFLENALNATRGVDVAIIQQAMRNELGS